MSHWAIRYAVYATFIGFLLAIQFWPDFRAAVRELYYRPLLFIVVAQ